ncbi:MAG: protein kinase, partial [Acidobacteriota bacterium]
MPTPRTQDETLEWSGDPPDPLGGASFAAGDVVAERYRIVRFVAAGGVGEVYEARDQELDQQVALKTLRRSRVSDRDVVERLKREIQLARQVTHPNVCRLYEFGHHESDGQRLLFLTMELLDGESLWERVQRGALSTEAALPLVRQMAAGLDAAHRAGVVHRDFKSSNVMLVQAEGDAEPRAVITDFGLARSVDDLPDKRLTSHDMRVGTPAYMAPEQVQGLEATALSDIYALGVVLFEMLTGRLPFEGNPLASAYQRLTKPPSSPSLYVPDLDSRWEHGILRCLQREPERRFQHATELAEALDPQTPTPLLQRLPSWTPGAAVLLLVLAVFGGLELQRILRGEGSPPALAGSGDGLAPSAGAEPVRVQERRSVAVLGLEDLSGQESLPWLASALSEMLTTEAAAGDRLRVVAGDEVARVRLEMGLDDPKRQIDRPLLSRIGRLLGCELVVHGSFLVAGEEPRREIRLDLVAQRVEDGTEVARLKERGSEGSLLDLVEDAGQSLRAALDLEALTAAEAEGKRASQPTARAARYYGRGLELLRRQETQRARELLEKAVEADPEHPLPRVALASALRALGFRSQAREEARGGPPPNHPPAPPPPQGGGGP